jgi:hypothetical protein
MVFWKMLFMKTHLENMVSVSKLQLRLLQKTWYHTNNLRLQTEDFGVAVLF